MSQAPPPVAPPMGYQQNVPPQAPRSNGAAVGSLICGLLGCLGITALAAIILGILGIKKAKDPQVGGKGMAIAGLVLGILWLIGSTIGIVALVGGGVAAVKLTEGGRDAAKQWMTAASAGDINK